MKKILIAEDDKFLANAYRVKLTKAGFEAKIVTDGREVLESIQTYTPDLIILDLIMPVKDGFTTLKELKENDTWKKIPVIVASNLGQKEDIDRGLELGANDYIVKSDLSLEDVISKVHVLLAGN